MVREQTLFLFQGGHWNLFLDGWFALAWRWKDFQPVFLAVAVGQVTLDSVRWFHARLESVMRRRVIGGVRYNSVFDETTVCQAA